MRSILVRSTLLALPLLLAACHGGDTAPGATTPGEDQQLNDAAAMLDANAVDANAVDLNDTGNDEDQPQ